MPIQTPYLLHTKPLKSRGTVAKPSLQESLHVDPTLLPLVQLNLPFALERFPQNESAKKSF